MSIGTQIKQQRLKKGYTLEELAKLVGTSKQTIQRYETGVISNIPSDKIEALAMALGVSPAYLMGWEDKEKTDIFSIPGIMPMPKMKRVPRLGTIACGEPIMAEENFEGFDNIPDFIDCDFSLTCKGDSMINARIYDGDLVFIKMQPKVENGEIAAVMIDGETTLKRVYLEDNQLILQPENSAYRPFVYVNEQINDVRILGKAVWFASKVK
ncbi:MAG: helix-turn-helix domain-containing protein [Clostridia bacterium]|nr:helix-turn-helix domain-containing protein [Clostridia bacterium]